MNRTHVAVSLRRRADAHGAVAALAIYLVKPSPFCLFDEVDAPLDESNVGRFIQLLNDFKEQTQFIVITHNPRTMESADWIYGVTMEEPGVSTIVGVELEGAWSFGDQRVA